MAVDVTLNTISSGYNASKINDNFDDVETALQDALSRSGNGPNNMSADLDLGGNDILNGGTAVFGSITVAGTDVGSIVSSVNSAVAVTAANASNSQTYALQAAAAAAAAQAAAGTAIPMEQQIHIASAKNPLADGDEFGLADSAASFAIKKVLFSTIKNNTYTALGALTAASTEKSALVDADKFPMADSAASNATKFTSWLDFKNAFFSVLGALTAAGTQKATLVAADKLMIADSASSNATKYTTVGNIQTAQAALTGVNTAFLSGMVLSNDAGTPASKIDISAGACRNSTDVDNIVIGSFVKNLTTTWVVGTGNAGLDTGTVANSTYHVFVIKRPDTGLVDMLFSLSPTAPTLPTNYTLFRRVGSIVRSAGSILAFIQDGDNFYWNNASLTADLSVTATRTKAALAINVPSGIRVRAHLQYQIGVNTGGGTTVAIIIYDGANTNIAATFASLQQTNQAYSSGVVDQYTNTSAQIQVAITGSPTTSSNTVTTLGWADGRGK